MRIDQMDDYTVNLADAYAKDAYQKGYEQGKKDAVKHSKWVKGNFDMTYCENCGQMTYVKTKYCAWCGCKMDEDTGGDYLDGEKPAKG